jgi:hypothetical protein
MSCPSWRALLAEREALGEDPRGFAEALAHLDGCPACRRETLALDPLLAFRRLPALAVSASDVEAMRQAVAAMRRASRVPGEAAGGAPLGGRPIAGRRAGWLPDGARSWGRAAAAVALLALGLTLGPGRPVPEPPSGEASTPSRQVQEALFQASFVEDLDLADARIYQVDSAEMQVVMIVHPSLDL